MKRIVLLLCFLSCIAEARAEEITSVDIKELYAALSYDWDGDGKRDHAFLVAGDKGDADLLLVTSRGQDMRLREFAIAGGMLTRPWLELNEANSLVVIQGNEAIGRNRWESRTVIAFREGQFVVAGYDYVARDTLDLDFNLSYSANYLTGKVIRNGIEKKVDSKPVPLTEWEPPNNL
ncbi:MAG: hypothetical protein CMO55_17325 [Verrucomicrobiales bacterium]|nr:hypothetical protein [Verrucomicrobiales bacterium]